MGAPNRHRPVPGRYGSEPNYGIDRLKERLQTRQTVRSSPRKNNVEITGFSFRTLPPYKGGWGNGGDSFGASFGLLSRIDDN